MFHPNSYYNTLYFSLAVFCCFCLPFFLASEDQEMEKTVWNPVQPEAPEQMCPDQSFLMMDAVQPRRWFPCPLNNHLFCFSELSALRCNWSVVYLLLFLGPKIALYLDGSQWAHSWLDGSLYPCSWLTEKPSLHWCRKQHSGCWLLSCELDIQL